MLTYLFLIIGFVFLIKGAGILVDGAASIAEKFNVSHLFIGLTIVALGTSLPELILNITASFKGAGDLAIGNIIGSNIANILLIVGLAALINPIRIRPGTTYKEISFSFLAILTLFFLANNFFNKNLNPSYLGRLDGAVLLILFLIFIYYILGLTKAHKKEKIIYDIKFHTAIFYIILGIIGLTIGGKLVIDNATIIAKTFGLSQSLIGLTVLAIGTSLPEMATSIIAAIKKNGDLAIGNIVGSSIFNIFFIMGISAAIKPIIFNRALNVDLIICAGATLILFWFMFNGKREKNITRPEGFGLLYLYVVYFVYLVWRG